MSRRMQASCSRVSSWTARDVGSHRLTTRRRSRRDLLQYRVDPGEAALRALLDAVVHRRVALLGRLEAHRLRELRLLAEVLELQRLEVVLERLHEPLRRLDLAELALD